MSDILRLNGLGFGVILNFMKESLCEPFFRFLRAGKVRRLVKKDSAVLDLGCGREGKFVKSLKSRVKTAVGIDKKAEPFEDGGISVQRGTFDGEPLPFADGTFDCVTMLAVIEHLKKRPETLKEARRVLKPGGLLVLTAPTWAAKPVLEFLAFRLGVVDKNEVADHKTYFWKSELLSLLSAAGFPKADHRYFQFGFNNFVYAVK